MKTKKWMCCMAAVAVMMTSSSCHEWGEMDPPAAGDIYPTLENVAQYTFDDETLDPMLFKTGSYTGVDIPELYADPEKGQVLYLNNGYVTMANPLASVTCQSAVSLTFWMKQGQVETTMADDDAEETESQDLTGALIGFTNDNESGRMFFTANGWISYTGLDGEWSENDPSQYETGYITPGEWHYVALTVRNDGYGIYVDGQRKVDKVVADFDMSKIVRFMNKVSTLYIGKGSDTDTAPWMIDDLKIYRNRITDKEIARPGMSGGGNQGGDFEFVVGDPILTVGAPDFSTPFWGAHSNYYRILPGTTLHLSFRNTSSGANNWNNWVLAVTTDADRDTPDYAEYIVLRADLYGWAGAYDGSLWTSEGYGDWDAFLADMNGAEVEIDLIREGNIVTVKATATAANGNVYTETYRQAMGDESEVLRTFLTVDAAYLEIHPDECKVIMPSEITIPVVGAPDFSTGFWGAHSDYFGIQPGWNQHIEFKNTSSGANNWNNWVLAVTTDADRDTPDYAEYIVLRADLYGWAGAYDGSLWTSEGYGDWDAFLVDMNGAMVNIDVIRDGALVTMTATAKAANGNAYTESYSQEMGEADQVIRTFLSIDGACLEMNPDGCYSYVLIYNK